MTSDSDFEAGRSRAEIFDLSTVRDVQLEMVDCISCLLSSALDANNPTVGFPEIARSNIFTSIVPVVLLHRHRVLAV